MVALYRVATTSTPASINSRIAILLRTGRQNDAKHLFHRHATDDVLGALPLKVDPARVEPVEHLDPRRGCARSRPLAFEERGPLLPGYGDCLNRPAEQGFEDSCDVVRGILARPVNFDNPL